MVIMQLNSLLYASLPRWSGENQKRVLESFKSILMKLKSRKSPILRKLRVHTRDFQDFSPAKICFVQFSVRCLLSFQRHTDHYRVYPWFVSPLARQEVCQYCLLCKHKVDQECFSTTWAFLIALHSATHHRKSTLGVCIWVFVSKHTWEDSYGYLAAFPIHCRHTAESRLNILLKLFNAVSPDLRTKLIGVLLYGTRNMSEPSCRVISWLRAALHPNCQFNYVLRGAHQLDDLFLHDYHIIVNGNLFAEMTAFIFQLPAQQVL